MGVDPLMGSVVARWTGREARALREAKRMSVREFAAHLGVNDAAVSNWEQRGIAARLRYETQQILDSDLTRSGAEVSDRFELILRSDPSHAKARTDGPQANLASASGSRTMVLLDTVGPSLADVDYRPDQTAVHRFQQFLDSPARTFVLAGRAGTGKTRLTRHLAQQWATRVDFQLHSCANWISTSTDVATEILRYASLPSGNDALLSVEQASNLLNRPLVVIIDDVDTDDRLALVGRQVDSILRQANSKDLRFILAVRTPPELDLSAYPVLAATAYAPPGTTHTESCSLSAWTRTEAREIWEAHRNSSRAPFTALPESLQSLATLPLYMQMLCSADGSDARSLQENGAFHLVDRCVRTLLARGGPSTDMVIGQMAQLASTLMPDVIPSFLTKAESESWADSVSNAALAAGLIIEQTSGDGIRFSHDVFREYFLAIRIVEEMTIRGRSMATVSAFNELAAFASRAATVHGVFDFAVCALSTSAPSLIDMIALAPSTSTDTALPMLIETAAVQGITLSVEVLRSCANRCTQTSGRQLARALLATPALPDSLAEHYAPWVVKQLRIHGSQIWADIAGHIEHAFDVRVSTRVLDGIDLDNTAEAVFVARYFDLFTAYDHNGGDLLAQLLLHLDWRVRAGLADALLERRTIARQHTDRIVHHLVRDDDYKVRAAIARVVGTLDHAAGLSCLETLLSDRNWHVRELALQGVLPGGPAPLPDLMVADSVIATVAADTTWAAPPASTAKLLTRIRLLSSDSCLEPSPAMDEALFGLLREVQTGWVQLPAELEKSIVALAESSQRWLTAREARATRGRNERSPAVVSIRERYRRTRGQRSLQIALDVHSLDRAVDIATAAVDAGADFIEVGDPLIKRSGVEAIATIKRTAPQAAVVAEMMSADWGRDQVELAAEAGADIVALIGPASIASVSAAVAAGRRLGVALVLDTQRSHVDATWLRDMERTGIDGFVVTTNIDLGVGSNHPLDTARTIRSRSQLPVAVSGGFSATDDELTSSPDWDIAIIGRSIADAVAPADLTYQLTSIVRKIHTQERP